MDWLFGSLGSIGLGAQALGGLISTFASYDKSSGEQMGYEYQSQVAKNNAKLLEWQAADALERGTASVQTLQLKKAQLRGRQESVFASRNVALDEGSALNILADTEFLGARDEAIASDNAKKEAYALRLKASNYADDAGFLAARADAQNPVMDAAGTALTSLGRVATSWYTMRTRNSAASPWE